jgi:hypothetical protein
MSRHVRAISLRTINRFLIMQEGRCIRCGKLFAHCGGDAGRDVMIPCQCCFKKMDGLICVPCAEKPPVPENA